MQTFTYFCVRTYLENYINIAILSTTTTSKINQNKLKTLEANK